MAGDIVPFSSITHEVTTPGDTDRYFILDKSGTPVSGYISHANLAAAIIAAITQYAEWQDADAMTYASATTFTVSGDKTAIYRRSVKIKLTQITVKYFSVVSSSYSSPNTTVTITGGSDYTLANAAITSPYYSNVENPEGFPLLFSWTPTFTGFSADPTGTHQFRILPDGMYVDVQHSANGTSNANTFYMTAPAGVTLTSTSGTLGMAYMTLDNGSLQTTPGRVIGDGTSYKIRPAFADTTDTTWTTSGGKRCRFTLVHPIV